MASAGAALALGLPAGAAEWWYGTIYLALQPPLTTFSSRVPFAWLDLLLVAVAAGMLRVWTRPLAAAARGHRLRATATAARRSAVFASAAYLLFLALWGANYSRPPLASRLAFEASRVDDAAVRELAERAVAGLNGLHAQAHARPWPATRDLPSVMGGSFSDVQRLLGATRLAVPAAPKPTLLGLYFRWASVSGLTDPFFLEVMITPDALPFERPAILAHEWAHLAGYANESDAEFVGWVTCVRGDAQARYSAWISLFPRLPRAARAAVRDRLAEGPRADFAAIEQRLLRASPTVTRVAWSGYDRFLRTHHVPEGVASYDAVVRLIAGTRFGEDWRPVLRGAP